MRPNTCAAARIKDTIIWNIPKYNPFKNKASNPKRNTDSLKPVNNIIWDIDIANKPMVFEIKLLSNPKKFRWLGNEKGHLLSKTSPMLLVCR